MMEEKKTVKSFGVDDYIGFAENLKQRCHRLTNVQGIGKLERKIHSEVKFLNSLKRKRRAVHNSHLHSSNLCHFASIVHAAENVPGVVSVLHPFRRLVGRDGGSLVVDVVAGHGYQWVKVIARKSQALHLVWAGQGQFGERDLVAQANEYKAAAENNLVHFCQPQVHLMFYNQVTRPMAEALANLDIHVWGQTVPVDDDVMLKLTSVLAMEDDVDFEDDFNDGEKEDDNDDTEEEEEEEYTIITNEDGRHGSQDDLFNDNGNQSAIRCRGSSQREAHKHPIGVAYSQQHIHCTAQSTSSPGATDPGVHPSLYSSNQDTNATEQGQFITTTAADHICDDCNTSQTNEKLTSENDKALIAIKHSSTCLSSNSITVEENPPTGTSDNSNVTDTIQTVKSEMESHSSRLGIATMLSESLPVTMTENDPKDTLCYDSALIHNCFFQSPSHPYDHFFLHIVSSPPDYRQFPAPHGNNPCLPLSSEYESGQLSSSSSLFSHGVMPPRRANLDITSLITLVSNVTHGHYHYVFRDKVLALQAEEERSSPCLPALERYLEGKELFTCQTAVSSFQSILDILGGQQEKERASKLMDRVTVVPDQLSPRAEALLHQGKIKARSKIVFGTGDSLQAVTVTSNSGFVRAAQHQTTLYPPRSVVASSMSSSVEHRAGKLWRNDKQGVNFSVFLHPARALTEEKEPSATVL